VVEVGDELDEIMLERGEMMWNPGKKYIDNARLLEKSR
jgi:hypothetical protein